MDTYIRAVNFLSRVAGVTAALLIALAVLVICDIVVERYILNLTTIWQIDVVTYSIVGATFVGSSYVLMTRGHVNVDILPLHCGPRARYWLALFTSLLAIAFCVATTLQTKPTIRTPPIATIVMTTDISRLCRLVRGAPRIAKHNTAKAIG